MRIRTKGNLFRRFRRVGITFTREWQDVDPAKLGPEKLAYLTGPESEPFLEIEGAPAAVPPAPAAVAFPPAVEIHRSPFGDDDDDRDEPDDLPAKPRTPPPPTPPPPKKAK